MSRLAPHPQPAPPRASAPRLRPALQRPPPASRAQPHAARPRAANPTTRQLGATRRRQPQRSPRRTDPRIQPGGMKPDLCTPQAANDRRRIARYRIEGLGKVWKAPNVETREYFRTYLRTLGRGEPFMYRIIALLERLTCERELVQRALSTVPAATMRSRDSGSARPYPYRHKNNAVRNPLAPRPIPCDVFVLSPRHPHHQDEVAKQCNSSGDGSGYDERADHAHVCRRARNRRLQPN
jgi:hypothetical protein